MTGTKQKPTWRELLELHKPLVLPGAHDALTARLIQAAGFPAYYIGGFPLIGARYALPDIGLVSVAEMSQAAREIRLGSQLPALVDIDDGHGDVKNVTRTIRTYEQLGASAVHLEDQVAPKRCGHMSGKVLVPVNVMEAKIRAAVAARESPDFFLIARTDARDVEGLDAALSRAERYIRAGADGLFIESPRSIEELGRIGRTFDVPQLANMLYGGVTPILSNRELGDMGFAMVIHGITPMMRAARAIRDTLSDLRRDELKPDVNGVTFEEYKQLVGFSDWASVDEKYGDTKARN
jgi:2,3-dimethylmalate lyase